MIIAVDFDGTIVEHRYPKIGEERPFAIETLKMPKPQIISRSAANTPRANSPYHSPDITTRWAT